VRDGVALGFSGFRCDAAYKVPAELWRHLIEQARTVDPEAKFFAETLGAPLEQVASLADAGFDFFFNSSKWWNFSEPWALDQHETFRGVAPSLAFPESHDTTRLAADTDGDEAVQRQRYAFAAAFSAGIMMPIGYEFGFRTQVNVVKTRPTDWERRWMDLRPFITRVNALKQSHPLLQGEGVLRARSALNGDFLVLERQATDAPLAERGWILVNMVWGEPRSVPLAELVPESQGSGMRLIRICRDDAPAAGEPVPAVVELQRAEVALVLPAAGADLPPRPILDEARH
jgi:starch synthase (maltosyl-transferring)